MNMYLPMRCIIYAFFVFDATFWKLSDYKEQLGHTHMNTSLEIHLNIINRIYKATSDE